MTLKEQLDADLREALRAQEETRKSTLRMLLSAVRNAEIPPEQKEGEEQAAEAQRQELDDEGVINVIRRQVKQRQDSIEAYEKANRQDLVDIEKAEMAVLQAYLPAQMSRDEIVAAAKAVIERVGAKGPADKGKVMPVIMSELRDKAEGREINAVVTELLAQ